MPQNDFEKSIWKGRSCERCYHLELWNWNDVHESRCRERRDQIRQYISQLRSCMIHRSRREEWQNYDDFRAMQSVLEKNRYQSSAVLFWDVSWSIRICFFVRINARSYKYSHRCSRDHIHCCRSTWFKNDADVESFFKSIRHRRSYSYFDWFFRWLWDVLREYS